MNRQDITWLEVGAAVMWFIAGFCLVFFRRPFARSVIRVQNVAGFRFGEREVRIAEVVAVIVGVFFLVLCVLVLMGIADLD